MDWTQPPSYEQVYDLLKRRARLRAELRIARFDLSVAEAHVKKRRPRDTASRLIGDKDSGIEDTLGIHRNIIALEGELDTVESELDFADYHRDMFKALVYRSRS